MLHLVPADGAPARSEPARSTRRPPEARVEEPRAALVERRRRGRAGNRSMLLGIVAGLAFFISTRHW